MPITVETIVNDPLQAAAYPQDLRENAVRLGANLTLTKGILLAKLTSDGFYHAYAQPDRSQTIVIPGVLTAGTWTITATKSDGTQVTTGLLAYNATAADVATALNAVLGASAVAVSGDYTGFIVVFSGTGYTKIKQPLITVDVAALTTPTSATVSDTTSLLGTEAPSCILIRACVTDASGLVYYSNSAVVTAVNRAYQHAQVYEAGTFKAADLRGWDDNAATAMGAHTTSSGYIRIP
jgi:hypothetical protein